MKYSQHVLSLRKMILESTENRLSVWCPIECETEFREMLEETDFVVTAYRISEHFTHFGPVDYPPKICLFELSRKSQ